MIAVTLDTNNDYGTGGRLKWINPDYVVTEQLAASLQAAPPHTRTSPADIEEVAQALEQMKKHPLWTWLSHLGSIKQETILYLLASVQPISRYKSIIHFFDALGVGKQPPSDRSGGPYNSYSNETRDPNPTVTLRIIVGGTMDRTYNNYSAYQEIYDVLLDAEIAENRGKLTQRHIQNRAFRKLCRCFAGHLYYVWKLCAGQTAETPWTNVTYGDIVFFTPPTDDGDPPFVEYALPRDGSELIVPLSAEEGLEWLCAITGLDEIRICFTLAKRPVPRPREVAVVAAG